MSELSNARTFAVGARMEFVARKLVSDSGRFSGDLLATWGAALDCSSVASARARGCEDDRTATGARNYGRIWGHVGERGPKSGPFAHRESARLSPPVTHDHDELLRRSEEAPAVAPEPALPRSPAVTVEALQRSAGNAAVARMIQAGGLMRQPAAPEAVCSPADQAKLDELMSTTYTREDFHPDTGAGLFDAVYAPGDGLLTITLGIAFEFLNGDPADPTWVASVGPGNVAKYGPEKFAWTAEEILNWKQNAITTVTGIWQRQYTFFTTKACWADTLPPVNVNIEIVERPATGEGKAHFVTSVTKWPTEPGIEESVTPPGAGADQSTARFHEQGSDPGGIESPDVNDFNTTTTERAKYNQVTTDNPGTIRSPQTL